MPNKAVTYLLKEVEELKKTLNDHLIQSGGIKTQLNFNTWLTGIMLIALLGKFIVEWFK